MTNRKVKIKHPCEFCGGLGYVEKDKIRPSTKETVTIGSRVCYEGDANDKGTIIGIVLDDFPFVVEWDSSKDSEERIDRFHSSQLKLVED